MSISAFSNLFSINDVGTNQLAGGFANGTHQVSSSALSALAGLQGMSSGIDLNAVRNLYNTGTNYNYIDQYGNQSAQSYKSIGGPLSLGQQTIGGQNFNVSYDPNLNNGQGGLQYYLGDTGADSRDLGFYTDASGNFATASNPTIGAAYDGGDMWKTAAEGAAYIAAAYGGASLLASNGIGGTAAAGGLTGAEVAVGDGAVNGLAAPGVYTPAVSSEISAGLAGTAGAVGTAGADGSGGGSGGSSDAPGGGGGGGGMPDTPPPTQEPTLAGGDSGITGAGQQTATQYDLANNLYNAPTVADSSNWLSTAKSILGSPLGKLGASLLTGSVTGAVAGHASSRASDVSSQLANEQNAVNSAQGPNTGVTATGTGAASGGTGSTADASGTSTILGTQNPNDAISDILNQIRSGTSNTNYGSFTNVRVGGNLLFGQ